MTVRLDIINRALVRIGSDPLETESSPEAKLRRLVLAFVHLILDELHATALTLDPESFIPPSSVSLAPTISNLERNCVGLRDMLSLGRSAKPPEEKCTLSGCLKYIITCMEGTLSRSRSKCCSPLNL